MIGQKLAHYRILEKLGEGGMGEVFRAEDTTLDREVALKVLPADLASSQERVERFQREARAVAALSHPHILAIHDFGSDAGITFVVMELLEGESLKQRLAEGPLPLRKTAEFAGQIARGLAAAHDKGVVHRDLKPDNIFVTKEGQIKILDFGLAKIDSARLDAATNGEAPTMTRQTDPGVVLGTVGYMSPEQVRGQDADARSDIFSLGVILYEMVTGTRAFSGDSTVETLNAILKEEPADLQDISREVSPALEQIIRHCLEKPPDERFQSASDLAFALENAAGPTSEVTVLPAETVEAAKRRKTGFRWLAVVVLALAAFLAGIAVDRRMNPPVREEPVQVRTLTFSGHDGEPSASPDGSMIAFTSDRDGSPRIWIKQLVGGGEESLTDGPDTLARFSPDGSTVLFLRSEGGVLSVYRQALVGGQARKLVENVTEADWSPNGQQIGFIRSRGSLRFGTIGVADAQDGTEREIAELEKGLSGLRWSPDGRRILVVASSFVTGGTPAVGYSLVMVNTKSGAVESTALGGATTPISPVVWNGPGDELLFARGGSFVGDEGDKLSRVVRYDLESGAETNLFWTEDIFPMLGLWTDCARFDIVRPGTLVFDKIAIRQDLKEFSLEGGAGAPSHRRITRSQARDRQPVYSPDGKRILFSSGRSGNLDLWILDLQSGALSQLTDDVAQDWDPAFTSDGKRVLWSSDRSGHLEIWISNADGSGAQQVTQDGLDAENPTSTADGEWIVYWSSNPDNLGVWKIRPDGTDATHLIEGTYLLSEVSPDGRHTACLRIEADNLRSVIQVIEVDSGEVVPFEIEVTFRLQAGDVFFGRSRWLPDGSAIAFVGVDDQGLSGVFAQDFVPGRDTSATRRRLAGFSREFISESFDISPDGRRLTIAGLEQSNSLVLAEGVPGVERPPAKR